MKGNRKEKQSGFVSKGLCNSSISSIKAGKLGLYLELQLLR